MSFKQMFLILYAMVQYPDCRLDWIEEGAVLTCLDGCRFLIPGRRKKHKRWSWMALVKWLVPAIILGAGLLMLWTMLLLAL